MKFLYGLILPAGTIGKDPISWSEEDLNGRVPIMFAESASSEYEDITSLRRIWDLWQLTGRDFIYSRKVAKEYFDTLPIGNCGCGDEAGRFLELSDDEKDAACNFQIGPQEKRIAFVGLSEILKRNLNYSNLTYDSRLKRSGAAITNLVTHLPSNYKEALKEIVDNQTFYKYIQFGLEGTVEGDPESLFDYILGRAGTSFDGIGLRQKPWTPINGLTMEQLTDLLITILKDGEYIYAVGNINIAQPMPPGGQNDLKVSVRSASTENIDLLAPISNIVDGVTMVDGDRILIKNQTDPTENGIYIWGAPLTRATDADGMPANEISSGMFVFVEEGTQQIGSGWILTTPNPIELGVTALTFVQFSEDHQTEITEITYANLMTLYTTGAMKKGFYKITDRGDEGIIVKANTQSSLDDYASGIFLNADYGAIGVYSGITGSQLGVWYAGLNPALDDVVIWNNRHYLKSVDGVEAIEPNASALYTLLPKSITTGHIRETDLIIYDFVNDSIVARHDKRGNKVNNISLSYFQFGNDNVYDNTIEQRAGFNCMNQRGMAFGNTFKNEVVVTLNNTHTSRVQYNNFGGDRSVICNIAGIVNKLNKCQIFPAVDIELFNGVGYENLTITPYYSNFTETLSLNDPTIYNAGKLTIPDNYNYVGVFTLTIVAATYNITSFDETKFGLHPITFISDVGKTGTFTPTDIGSAVAGDYVSGEENSDTIVGRIDGNDELVVKLSGNLVIKVSSVTNATTSSGDKHFEHSQALAESIWNINHNMNKYPSVSLVDDTGTVMYAEILHLNNDNVRVTFSEPVIGKAYLN